MWKKNTCLGTFSQREAVLCPEMVALDTMAGDVPLQPSVQVVLAHLLCEKGRPILQVGIYASVLCVKRKLKRCTLYV